MLVAEGLVKHFPVRSKGLIRRRSGEIHAVCDVSLTLHAHQTLALVGESGCGKSTTARMLLNLIPPTRGRVSYRGQTLTGLSSSRMRPLRRSMQIVFQDPFASLDPRMTVFDAVAEPLRIHGQFRNGGAERVRELFRLVGLDPAHGNRYPHEFSGGQRQRVGIARALALEPEVLVLDEPVSALDVSVQAGVINLLEELQERLGLSYLFVSHDLAVVRHLADQVAVMYLGRIVETAPVERLFTAAAHPYTQALISAVPIPDPRRERARQRIVLRGDVPSPMHPPRAAGSAPAVPCSPVSRKQSRPAAQQRCRPWPTTATTTLWHATTPSPAPRSATLSHPTAHREKPDMRVGIRVRCLGKSWP